MPVATKGLNKELEGIPLSNSTYQIKNRLKQKQFKKCNIYQKFLSFFCNYLPYASSCRTSNSNAVSINVHIPLPFQTSRIILQHVSFNID